MGINEMTRKELLDVPHKERQEDIGEFDSLIIIPTRRKHDSGYRMMEFVAVKGGKPFRRVSGWSDVVHIGGMSALIDKPKKVAWSIDCLMKSGLLHLFCHQLSAQSISCLYQKLTIGCDLSSFDILSSEWGPELK